MAGGFSRFQIQSIATILFISSSCSHMIYGLTFLELRPQYTCLKDGHWEPCDADRDIC